MICLSKTMGMNKETVEIHLMIEQMYKEKGINVCKGCFYEHTASCGDNRYPICHQRFYSLHIRAKQRKKNKAS